MTASNWVGTLPSQEAYTINRILYDVQHDRAEEARYFADPKAYLADIPGLSDRAVAALSTTDVGQLYLLGANPYLLRAYCLQLRMPDPEYLAALRAVGGANHG
ncbi:hypothetical protein [Sphingomonas sp.]|uniref:hypothetical protein n=1 Tax=Sphingomonas sp. TaxID=28214 RepID=UPI000BD7856F|nr:hypothetical protein [Sphingomonas sp.]MBA4761800.1 subunit of meta cleavage enzyme [Sphingomonas sp.]OYW21105.1 MAG: hypothetical protein B7Z52_01320 [Burkholderiales bacterium 12-64-5]